MRRGLRRPSTAVHRRSGTVSASVAGGQTLVEFALVVPLFLTILLSIVEFGFAFNAILAANFATRDAALVAAEAGNQAGADCVILRTIDDDMGAPTDPGSIQSVEIYRANAAGTRVGSATIYERTGSFSCVLPDGVTVEVPYRRIANGYPEASRCDVLAGCPDPAAPLAPRRPLDHIGVLVTYHHTWKTPIGAASGPFLEVIRSNAMRMEPIL